MKTRKENIADLKLAKYNPRKISKDMLENLKESIKTYGFLQPVIVNDRTGVVVSGHQRIDAAKSLGWTKVPVLRVDLDDAQERALNVAMNKIGGDFDNRLLFGLLGEIRTAGCTAITGYTEQDWRKMALTYDAAAQRRQGRSGDTPALPAGPSTEGEQDEAAYATPVRAGETYRLGRHIVHCGSAVDPASYAALGTVKARMMLTDPPYNVAYRGSGTSARDAIANDDMASGAFESFLEAALGQALKHNSGVSYVFYATSQTRSVHNAWIRLAGTGDLKELQWTRPDDDTENPLPTGHMEILSWQKQNFVLGRSHYKQRYEAILYGWHKSADNKYWCGDNTQSNVLTYPRPLASTDHPTMKPVPLLERLVLNSSEPDDWVIEPFAGSGSTLVACENLERSCYAIELEPGYVDVIVRRYLSLDGHGPVELIGTVDDSSPRWWEQPAPMDDYEQEDAA